MAEGQKNTESKHQVPISEDQKEEVWQETKDAIYNAISDNVSPVFIEIVARKLKVHKAYQQRMMVRTEEMKDLASKVADVVDDWKQSEIDQEFLVENLIAIFEKDKTAQKKDFKRIIDELGKGPMAMLEEFCAANEEPECKRRKVKQKNKENLVEVTHTDKRRNIWEPCDENSSKGASNTKPLGKRRMALLIGITYKQSSNEPNPYLPGCAKDIKMIEESLELVGWTCVTHMDVELHEIKSLVEIFANALREADDALFYFSGHGCTINGHLFLIPMKMYPKSSSNDIWYMVNNEDSIYSTEGVKLYAEKCYNLVHAQNLFIDKVKDNPKIMIMDCCRTRMFDRELTKGYNDVINNYPEMQKRDGARNLIHLFATNDHNEAAACTGESHFSKKLAPLIKQKLDVAAIQKSLDKAAKDEKWSQKPTFEGTGRANYKF